jgi:hypothetical protein
VKINNIKIVSPPLVHPPPAAKATAALSSWSSLTPPAPFPPPPSRRPPSLASWPFSLPRPSPPPRRPTLSRPPDRAEAVQPHRRGQPVVHGADPPPFPLLRHVVADAPCPSWPTRGYGYGNGACMECLFYDCNESGSSLADVVSTIFPRQRPAPTARANGPRQRPAPTAVMLKDPCMMDSIIKK